MEKTIIIIGAGPGLGQAIAKKFAKEQFNVVLVARNEEKLKAMVSEVVQLGIKATYKVADVASDTYQRYSMKLRLRMVRQTW